MITTMASSLALILPLLATSILASVFSLEVSMKITYLEPFKCSSKIRTCNASLYHISHDLTIEEISHFYSVNSSQVKPIMRGTKLDYLITVPCSCKNTIELSGYFYDTTYKVRANDTFVDIQNLVYSGQAWPVDKEDLVPDEDIAIHIPCGCSESDSQIVVTYTVERNDTPTSIAHLLNATFDGMVRMNQVMAPNPSFIDIGWVLFVPMELKGSPLSNGKGKLILCCIKSASSNFFL